MSHNDITGDRIATRSATDKFREGWDGVFGKKPCGKCPRDTEYGPAICGHCLETGLAFPDDANEERAERGVICSTIAL